MSTDDPSPAYRHLANELFQARVSERDLQEATVGLPLLNKDVLDTLAKHAEESSTTRPRYGWAIARVAYATSISQDRDIFLRSLTAWYLARAANHWTQPGRVREAIAAARRGFEELNDAGWLAACDWQLNALPWTRPDFGQAARTLAAATRGLEQAGLREFVSECRLAWAYAQILTGEHEAALENIQRSEEIYAGRGDALNQARCWLHQASSLRRRDQFQEAFQKLAASLAVFEKEGALADQAKTHYQIALGHLLQVENLAEAVAQFTRAAELFRSLDLDLWRAMCINNLGSVYLFTGELALSDKYYQEAGAVFTHHEIPGLLADNLNDHGEVNILRGQPQISVDQFRQSIAINENLGAQLSIAVAMTNLGKAYGQSGRYQDALFYLEQAAERLAALHSPLRLGTCEKYAALIWSQLGQPALTHRHLDRAVLHYESADQKAMLTEVHNVRATAFFQQGENEKTIDCLKESLAGARLYGVRPQATLARRLLGEAQAQNGEYKEALEHLQQCQIDFSEMEMAMDLAASLVAAGTCYAALSDTDRAQRTFEQALQLSDGILPEIEWRAHVALGDLAVSRVDTNLALQAYAQAVDAFARIRHNFWQPGLAGSYLQRPSRIFDRIVSVASAAHKAEDALLFIEQSKAATLSGQLLSGNFLTKDPNSQVLRDIEAEILFLQDQLRTSLDMPLPMRARSDYRQTRARLSEKTLQYEMLKSELERRTSHGEISVPPAHGHFDLALFRELAKRALQKEWIAFDYYLTDDRLVIITVDPERCEVLDTVIPYRFRVALEACRKAAQNAQLPTDADLHVLGQMLIPSFLADHLTPDTFLLLSPHKALHAVPWPALQPDFSSRPLVHLCTPTIVPAMHSLEILWRRDKPDVASKKAAGVLVGLSTFEGRRRELPHVRTEVGSLSSHLGTGGVCLAEEEATWENLSRLTQRTVANNNEGLARFAWLHIASHFFSHAITGRLSGLTLADGDVWLDKLRDLSPLPGLVTLSACNSISSFVYEGDEHVDLPTTLLVAGADRVIGSLWPVLDEAAAEFTARFYDHYLAGSGPSRAVTQTQRALIDQGCGTGQWAGFICIGTP